MVPSSRLSLLVVACFLALLAGCSGRDNGEPEEELYLMSAGDPDPYQAEYKRLLKERYNVGYSWGHHGAGKDIKDHNERVKAELEKRHGEGVLEKLQQEARENLKARRR